MSLKTRLDNRQHLQFWDRNPPSRLDALFILTKALYLLAESLPLALQHIGTEGFEEQTEFWRAFLDFDNETDITEPCGYEPVPSEGNLETIRQALNDWAEVAYLRIDKKTGEIK